VNGAALSAAGDKIPGNCDKLPCYVPIVAVESEICCPARLLAGGLAAAHEAPKA
jgi:hypothetical protein